ncbi:EF-P lysine aminoacylase EpmA [Aeoliella sp. ICT_H6.2]|uniref:EF-P lysine aminoacylase EpmA n=1 Tax=Aeoliella straminimaris TaxID=2954799 RepID=A0A9X2JID6_9BACT|nr:EF-P lysine aminoacylase EpmA [Aeoliella straminimaris]MCO6046467.1 EF-P lysine aminoacylase EpmA [Aeoliella straminimaris]
MTSAILKRRAELLANVRQFFSDRGFTEVATPRVDVEIIPELHIDPFEAPGLGYLQASPEMHMKRLLCAGSGPIFEIAQCFRRGERGKLHRPEFTMIEWYRPGDDMQAGMGLLDELLQQMLGTPTATRTSYREAFQRSVGIDPHTAPLEQLQKKAGEVLDDRDELLNLLLARHVEPALGSGAPELLYHYPASQSALAATTIDEQAVQVAERFELYHGGVELANGYHELTDPVELRERLAIANEGRTEFGRPTLPLPEMLLAAMTDPGMPPCAGVALGFDRLLMLAVGAESIDEVVI